jgi:hypothetical protein
MMCGFRSWCFPFPIGRHLFCLIWVLYGDEDEDRFEMTMSIFRRVISELAESWSRARFCPCSVSVPLTPYTYQVGYPCTRAYKIRDEIMSFQVCPLRLAMNDRTDGTGQTTRINNFPPSSTPSGTRWSSLSFQFISSETCRIWGRRENSKRSFGGIIKTIKWSTIITQ